MKNTFLVMSVILLWCGLVYGQSLEQAVGQLGEIAGTMGTGSGGGMLGGFSWWGIIWGFLFGSIGFIAFVYGKKNAEYKVMTIGIVLMVYPYFVRGTTLTFIVGLALTAALYFFR